MPYDDPDSTDPMTLHGTVVETDNPEVHREMATCFVEEYMRIGYGRSGLLAMFKIPDYIGPYMAYRALGEAAIGEIIDEVAERWGGRREGRVVGRDEEGQVRPL